MDLRQIEYILKIAEENNITRAAQKLFISQSALNQQLLKLEKELGVQLFHRSRTNWRPTKAGEIYLEGARKIMHIKEETYARIGDQIRSQNCHLTIGLSPGRGLRMFTSIYPEFHRLCPNYTLTPLEMQARAQQAALARSELDFGFIMLTRDQEDDNAYLELVREEMILAVPASMSVSARYGETGDSLPVLHLTEIADRPFITMNPASTLRSIAEDVFRREGIRPDILMEISSTQSMLDMVRADIGCSIIPVYYADFQDPSVKYYRLHGNPSWRLCIVHRKDAYVSEGMKTFTDLARDYWYENIVML